MSAQRNSQNGKMKAPDHMDQDQQPQKPVTDETPFLTTPRVVLTIIGGCIGAAILWSTLSLRVNADSTKIEKVEIVAVDLKDKVQIHSFTLEKHDTRITALEDWRKEMQQQRDDIKAIRAMLEESRKDKKP